MADAIEAPLDEAAHNPAPIRRTEETDIYICSQAHAGMLLTLSAIEAGGTRPPATFYRQLMRHTPAAFAVAAPRLISRAHPVP